MGNADVLAWFREKYRIGEETAARLKIGFADNGEESVTRDVIGRPGRVHPARVDRDVGLPAHRSGWPRSVLRWPDRLSVLEPRPGRVHDRAAHTRGRPITNGRNRSTRSWPSATTATTATLRPASGTTFSTTKMCFLTRPERVIITEGVTDCISLMEHGFPVVSPVTVQIREADWERLLPKLDGVKTVFICQDNEISASRHAGRVENGARPGGARHPHARGRVAAWGKAAAPGTRESSVWMQPSVRGDGQAPRGPHRGCIERRRSGRRQNRRKRVLRRRQDRAADFEAILAAAQTPLEMAISKLDSGTPDEQMEGLLEADPSGSRADGAN